jgi:predicted Zn-dependent protease
MRKYAITLIPVLALLFAAGCGSSGIGSGSSITLDQEWQLGNQLAAQVQQQVRLVNDPQITSYVRSVGERLHAQTPLANRPFDFQVVDDPAVNAFAIPGGHVYINTGLIEAVGSILLGQNPNVLAGLAAQILAGGAMARFSRADEKEADDLGLPLMAQAGFNPQGMLDMFNKLLSLEKSRPSSVERFFSDHPMTTERIKDIQSRINKMGNPGGITDEPQYQDVRRRIGV